MKPTILFPDADLPPEVAADRGEPALWLRRLVVVARRVPDAEVIRDVSFRRGLNVIRVAERPAGEVRPIGHSVGKTLLSRLIRYCLGESHFAVPEVMARIAAALPGACVLAEIAVGGRWWVTARPLRDAPGAESWAVPADDWRAGLGDAGGLQRYGDFLTAVSLATVAGLPELRLPGAGHSARWLDLLGWLARDQECSYQHANEWRDPDANSGTGRLPRDDASLLMQWAMGLLNTDEIDELTGRQQLLRDHDNAAAEVERRESYLASTGPALAARLGLREEDLAGALFTLRAGVLIDEEIRALRGRLAELTGGAELAELRAAAVRAAEAEAVVRSELAQRRALPRTASARATQPTCPLEKADCPLFAAKCAGETAAPALAELEGRLAALQEKRAEAEAELEREEQRRRGGVEAVLTQIGRWQLLGEELRDYEAALRRRDDARARAEALERQARESRDRQQAARGERDRWHRRLCDHFDRTLRQLLGPDAGGAIRLDARGLHPEPDASVAANGAALTTLATVLGLDLACLAATACGVGHLPGFLLHDSPKEADLEPVLYERIFTAALRLEEAFGSRPPAFQYIITTTSPPPDAVTTPHVRLVLDARHDAGLFLRRRF